ncbi:hypothetical protein [Pedococcus sp. P5_B7]
MSGQLAAMETEAVETLPPRMGLTKADEHEGRFAVTFGIANGELQLGWLTVRTAVPKPVLAVICQASPRVPISRMLPDGRFRVTLQVGDPSRTVPPGQCCAKSLSLTPVIVFVSVVGEQAGGGVAPLQINVPVAEKPVIDCPAGQVSPASPVMPGAP